MIVGVVPDGEGNPVCSELWPGNTADVKALVPVVERIRSRFTLDQGPRFRELPALVLMKELYRRLKKRGFDFEWGEIVQDLSALEEITVEDNRKKLAIRSTCKGVCGKVFQAAWVTIPLTIREVR